MRLFHSMGGKTIIKTIETDTVITDDREDVETSI